MTLAARVEGRTIHITVDVWLAPPEGQDVGEVDPALEIGKGLIREALMLLKAAADAEGFSIDIKAKQVVF